MDINYMGISTGKIVLTTEQETVIGERPVYHVNARVKTADYYRYLYELDDNIDSYILKDIYSPVKFSLIQRESGQDVDDLQLFDIEKLKTYSFYKAKVFNKAYLKNKDGQYQGYPHRSYVGTTWQGGYSDHFPVYLLLVKEKK